MFLIIILMKANLIITAVKENRYRRFPSLLGHSCGSVGRMVSSSNPVIGKFLY